MQLAQGHRVQITHLPHCNHQCQLTSCLANHGTIWKTQKNCDPRQCYHSCRITSCLANHGTVWKTKNTEEASDTHQENISSCKIAIGHLHLLLHTAREITLPVLCSHACTVPQIQHPIKLKGPVSNPASVKHVLVELDAQVRFAPFAKVLANKPYLIKDKISL